MPRAKSLSLEALLNDPVTQAVMRADRVDAAAFEAMLRKIATGINAAVQNGNTRNVFARGRSILHSAHPFTHAACRVWEGMPMRDGIGRGMQSDCRGAI